ncbi:hypothetical protein EI555_018494, partial [Monodon monoceros]
AQARGLGRGQRLRLRRQEAVPVGGKWVGQGLRASQAPTASPSLILNLARTRGCVTAESCRSGARPADQGAFDSSQARDQVTKPAFLRRSEDVGEGREHRLDYNVRDAPRRRVHLRRGSVGERLHGLRSIGPSHRCAPWRGVIPFSFLSFSTPESRTLTFF